MWVPTQCGTNRYSSQLQLPPARVSPTKSWPATGRALAAGAAHVQLAVVNGNTPAERLYQGLGFEPFDTVRTILFAS